LSGREFPNAAISIVQIRAKARWRPSASDAPHCRLKWTAVCGAKGKRRLNRSILDQGWFEFRRQLEYKLKWNDGRLIAVSPQRTSITCPRCRHFAKQNRLSQSQFQCGACGFQENADLVGALNVLRAGHARLACAETSLAYGALPMGRRAKNPPMRSRRTFDRR
jgi:transposase